MVDHFVLASMEWEKAMVDHFVLASMEWEKAMVDHFVLGMGESNGRSFCACWHGVGESNGRSFCAWSGRKQKMTSQNSLHLLIICFIQILCLQLTQDGRQTLHRQQVHHLSLQGCCCARGPLTLELLWLVARWRGVLQSEHCIN